MKKISTFIIITVVVIISFGVSKAAGLSDSTVKSFITITEEKDGSATVVCCLDSNRFELETDEDYDDVAKIIYYRSQTFAVKAENERYKKIIEAITVLHKDLDTNKYKETEKLVLSEYKKLSQEILEDCLLKIKTIYQIFGTIHLKNAVLGLRNK